jgi:hypothetical protein
MFLNWSNHDPFLLNLWNWPKQIEVIVALEGVGIRTVARLTGVNRGTVGALPFALKFSYQSGSR